MEQDDMMESHRNKNWKIILISRRVEKIEKIMEISTLQIWRMEMCIRDSRSTEQPPVDISFTIFHQQWGCTKHLQDEWQPEKNKRRDKSANDNGSSHAYRESPAGFVIFLSTDMKSSKRTSACRKGKCDTVQNIYKRIDNVDRSECICSNISRNKDSINDRINCSK